MPEMLEALLWCAAMATWLMLLFRTVQRGLSKLSNPKLKKPASK